MRFVTSFSQEGFDLYGKRFLESYKEHVGLPLDIYFERTTNRYLPEGMFHSDPLFTWHNLYEVPGMVEFLKLADFPAAKGDPWNDGKYNYRFACFRFSRKCFAQLDAASKHSGYLYWIDADVEFKGAFEPPHDFAFMAYLGRPEWHSCASFIGWNLDHPKAKTWFTIYRKLHETGAIFCLPEWHDSFLVDWVRGESKLPALNLAEGMKLEGPANVFDAVFPMAHHKKGNLKFEEAA